MTTIREMRVTKRGVPHLGEVYELRSLLNRGGLVILPSDTCYALAGIPFVRGVTSLIDRILSRGDEKMPLAFGSLHMIERYVQLGEVEYRISDDFMPGPITLVGRLRPDLPNGASLAGLLHTTDTLGARIPDSSVERQLSTELDLPLTTAAITYANREGTKNFEDAVDIVTEGIAHAELEQVSLAAIKHPDVRNGERSTVVESSRDRRGLQFHREGAIDPAQIRRAVERYHLRDVEDWT